MTEQLDQRYLFGDLLRDWRGSRNMTQMALADKAETSTRHLSFVENGRSAPSRNLVMRLAEHLDVPLRGRNRLLLAAGFAPECSEQPLDAPQLSMVRLAISKVLTGHNPYPALVVDRGWNLVEANASIAVLIAGLPEDLLAPPCNVLRLSLHRAAWRPRFSTSINGASTSWIAWPGRCGQVAIAGWPRCTASYSATPVAPRSTVVTPARLPLM